MRVLEVSKAKRFLSLRSTTSSSSARLIEILLEVTCALLGELEVQRLAFAALEP
jgi:hypothetical protein